PWAGLVWVAFAGAFLLPRQFHVAFVERPSDGALRSAAWSLPALLWLLVLPVPVLLLAGESAAPGANPDLYVLLWSSHPAVRSLAFLAGASAASAMVLAETLSLSGMVVTHLVLPLRFWRERQYRDLGSVRRATVLGMVLAGFVAHLALPHPRSLVDLGVVSFTAALQLLPGIVATLFWPRATRVGFVLGLVGGGATFAAWVAAPLLGLTGDQWFDPRDGAPIASVAVNAALLVAGSLVTRPSRDEQAAAATCAGWVGESGRPPVTVGALVERLGGVLGPEHARAEVDRALASSGIDPEEDRPLVLRRLAEEVESQLAGLVGALAARRLVRGTVEPAGPVATQMRALAERRTPTDPYDEVRRYLFSALHDLPFAVAAVDPAGDLVVWNQAAVAVTGLSVDQVIGRPLGALPAPWDGVLAAAGTAHGERVVEVRHSALGGPGGTVVVFDDQTERRSVARRLEHRDRLATVGRLAAGVAHEVRNPLTGLLMVARNLEAEVDDPELKQRLALIGSEGGRIERIVRGLLELALDREPAGRGPVDVTELAERAAVLARLGATRGVSVRVEVPPGLRFDADGEALLQVVLNLTRNALHAAPDGSEVQLRAGAGPDGGWLEVVDAGDGVPSALVGRLFEPFFTTKPPGEGTGLGLAVSARMAEAQGGRLTYERGEHTRFRVDRLAPWERPDP
ncbi:MAG: ATP-binding protein, partial [Myxococcota bacterium]